MPNDARTRNALNQYTAISTSAPSAPPREPTYDSDGNLLIHGAFAFAWDAENRNTSVISNGIPFLSNAYDHHHRRVRKTTPTATHAFLYDGWNPIRETVTPSTGAVTTNLHYWGIDLSGTLQGAGGVWGYWGRGVLGSYFDIRFC